VLLPHRAALTYLFSNLQLAAIETVLNTAPVINYTAFYPSRPFWTISRLDLRDPSVVSDLTDRMSEIVLTFDQQQYTLKICRDGMFMLRIHELELQVPQGDRLTSAQLAALWADYLDCLNTLQLLFESSVLEIMKHAYFELGEITTRDAFRVSFDDQHKWTGNSVPMFSPAASLLMARYTSSYSPALPPFADARFLMRIEVPETVFVDLNTHFTTVLAAGSAVQRLATLAKSLAEFKIGNYPTSLVLSWFVIESSLLGSWRNLLDAKSSPAAGTAQHIGKKRREALTGRDFPIAVVLNVLELSDVLAFDEWKDLDEIRGFRNKVVHQDPRFKCEATHAIRSLQAARRLLEQQIKFSLRPNLGYTVTGM